MDSIIAWPRLCLHTVPTLPTIDQQAVGPPLSSRALYSQVPHGDSATCMEGTNKQHSQCLSVLNCKLEVKMPLRVLENGTQCQATQGMRQSVEQQHIHPTVWGLQALRPLKAPKLPSRWKAGMGLGRSF